MTLRAALLGLVIAALLAVAVERGLAWQDARAQANAGDAASEAAADAVTRLVTVSSSTSEETIKELLDGATSDFRSELEAQADDIQKTIASSRVTATGEVVSTGVVSAEEGTATVLVAAVGTVNNKAAREAQPRNYRLEVDLRQVDGRWLVSGLEFVA